MSITITRNKTKFPEFVNLCKMSQKELKEHLSKMDGFVSGDGFLYHKGTVPVLLTAHMDTVHHELVKDFVEEYDDKENIHIITSPQGIGGDDRCGIYMILQIMKEFDVSILFCEDEEIGRVGAEKFLKTEYANDLLDLKYMIELDRANYDDAVFYDCDNPDFTDWIIDNTGYKEDFGSYSDISSLAPFAKVAAVNLSCGYYKAHTTSEYVIVEEMLYTIEVVKRLLTIDCEQFEYIEKKHSYYYYGYAANNYGGFKYDYSYFDDDKEKGKDEVWGSMEIRYLDKNGKESFEYEYGFSEDECLLQFFKDHGDVCYNDILDWELF